MSFDQHTHLKKLPKPEYVIRKRTDGKDPLSPGIMLVPTSKTQKISYYTGYWVKYSVKYWEGFCLKGSLWTNAALVLFKACYFIFLKFIYFGERAHEHDHAHGGEEGETETETETETERERERIPSWQHGAGSREVHLTNCEIVTWTEIKSWTLGAPGWFRRRLSIQLQLRSWPCSSWVQALRWALCWQLRAWSLFQAVFPSLFVPPLLSLSQKLKIKN